MVQATSRLRIKPNPSVESSMRRSAPAIVRVTRTLARVIPGAALRQIEGAGHAAPFDAPAAFAKAISDAITTA